MLQRLRCNECGATILFHDIINGVVEVMCRHTKCKSITRIKCSGGVCRSEQNVAPQNTHVV